MRMRARSSCRRFTQASAVLDSAMWCKQSRMVLNTLQGKQTQQWLYGRTYVSSPSPTYAARADDVIHTYTWVVNVVIVSIIILVVYYMTSHNYNDLVTKLQ